jgi:hypothetical protein
MKFPVILVFVFSLIASVPAQGQNPDVTSILGELNSDSLTHFVSELSGVVPVNINDKLYTISSRYDTARGNEIAARYIYGKLLSFGLIPQFQDFTLWGRNVYALQTGTEHPGQIYILCAHYDDKPWGSVAPGADDNASGTAAVLEAARILSKHQTSYSILYALWDREEQGLIGSSYYAAEAATRGDSILGVINLDMIAWDSNSDMVMDIHTKDIANSLTLSDTVQIVNALYGIGLYPVFKNPGSTASDHASFWNHNFSALMLIESYPGDFNAYYHSVYDQITEFNNIFFVKNSKLALGTISVLAGVRAETGILPTEGIISQFSLGQNYPNPFNPVTTIRYSLPSMSPVVLEVFDMLGRRVETLVREIQPTGEHTVQWNASGNPSGMYVYRLIASNFTTTKIMGFLK